MVGVDMVFSQLRAKGWKLSISPACLHKATFGGISGFPRDISTGGVNRVLIPRIPRVADDELSQRGATLWSHNAAISRKVLLYTLSV